MDFFEKTIRSDVIYTGKIIRLRVDEVLLPDGNKSKREIVEHPGAVAVVPLDEKDNIILVRQYRKALEKELLEIPAGKLEVGEDVEICAQRELGEETGFHSEELLYLSEFYTSPGFCNEKVYLYLARHLKAVQRNIPGDEFIEIERLSFSQILEKTLNGEIEDAKTIAGVLLAERKIKGMI